MITFAADEPDQFSDEEIREFLNTRGVLLDGPAAVALTKRGFAPLMGVEAQPKHPKKVSFEKVGPKRTIPVNGTLETAALKALPGTEVLSTLWHRRSRVSPEAEELGPGLTFYRSPGGGRVAFMATPVVYYGASAFTMLNESRKAQLLEIFERLGGLDWYVPGDDEVLVRQGGDANCTYLTLTNLSLDPMAELPLCGSGARQTAQVETLAPDGSWRPLEFRRLEDRIVVNCPLEVLVPTVLRFR